MRLRCCGIHGGGCWGRAFSTGMIVAVSVLWFSVLSLNLLCGGCWGWRPSSFGSGIGSGPSKSNWKKFPDPPAGLPLNPQLLPAGGGAHDRGAGHSHSSSPSQQREPAGAESLFSTAETMVRNRMPFRRPGSAIDKSEYNKNSRRQRWIRRQILKRRRVNQRRKRRQNVHSHTHTNEDDDPDLLVKRARKNISLPPWAFANAEEEKRLAAMKSLLERDVEEMVRGRTVRLVAAAAGTTAGNSAEQVDVADAFPDVYGDLRLLRFLRKDDPQNPEAAAARYRAFLAWRRKHGVDERIRCHVEAKPFRPPHPVVAEHLPYDFQPHRAATTASASSSSSSSSSHDDPFAIVLDIGSWRTGDVASLVASGELPLDDFLSHWIYAFESLHRELHAESHRRGRLIRVDEVCDLKGARIGQLSPGFVSKVLRPFVAVMQSYYPETTSRISLLNPPSAVSLAWKVVSPMVSAGTQKKIRFVSGFEGTAREYIFGLSEAKEEEEIADD